MTSLDIVKRAESLVEFYRTGVRSQLEEHGLREAVESLDRSEAILRAALKRDTTLSIGFLGESQVGKSTIINALVGVSALPSGGVGPLTAQATRVSYRDQHGFSVKYHGRNRLNEIRLALESDLKRKKKIDWALDEADAQENYEIEDAIHAEEGTPKSSSKLENLMKSVQLLLERKDGPKPTDLPEPAIVDALRLMQGQAPKGDVTALEPFMPAIVEIRSLLGESETFDEDDEAQSRIFVELERRAAGWMSPLIDKLDVGLRQSWLLGLELVDLPGMNNFQDAGGSVAQEFIRERQAGALLLVLRNNGITENLQETLGDILDRYGVIERLLWGSNDKSPSLHLGILITRLDDVAKDRRRRLRDEKRRGANVEVPSPDELFSQLASEMETMVREQFRQAVRAHIDRSKDEGSQLTRARIVELCDALEKDLQVICVAAPEFLELKADPDESFLKSEEATNIPRLRDYLRGLADDASRAREQAIEEAFDTLHQELSLHLASIRRLYEEGGGRASVEYERFRDALESTRAALSAQVEHAHKRALRELNEELAARIEDVLKEAAEAGRKRLNRLRKNAEKMYWASLNAALRHEGHWTTSSGKSISYPEDLRRAITEEISGHWEPIVIQSVRNVIGALVDEDLSYVEALCEKAVELGSHLVDPQHVEEQKQILRAEKNTTVRWTRERLDELTEEVRVALRDPILEPLKKACEAARRAGKNRGQGAKLRIIETFESGGTEAVGLAVDAARKVLERQYGKVLAEIRSTYLKDAHDPVTSVFEELTHGEKVRANRSDGARRRRILETIEQTQSRLLDLVALAS